MHYHNLGVIGNPFALLFPRPLLSMKILCFTASFWPEQSGGIAKSVFTEVEGLTVLGHEVTVLTHKIKADEPSFEKRGAYQIIRYESGRLPGSSAATALIGIANARKEIARLVRDNRFDGCLAHATFQAAAIPNELAIPWIFIYHASAPSEIRISAAGGKYGWQKGLAYIAAAYAGRLERKAIQRADAVIVRSDFMKQDLQQRYSNWSKKLFKIPLGVEVERYAFAACPLQKRAELSLPKERFIVLAVRRLVARVGLPQLIQSVKLIADRFPNLLLLIAGRGYLEQQLKKQVCDLGLQDHVRMLGYVSEELLPAYYQSADLSVMPTTVYEGFGLSTIESLACGTPVLATPVGANPEILEPLGTQFLSTGNEPEAIANGLQFWLKEGSSPAVRTQCREYCVQNFAQRKIAEQFHQALSETITDSRIKGHVEAPAKKSAM